MIFTYYSLNTSGFKINISNVKKHLKPDAHWKYTLLLFFTRAEGAELRFGLRCFFFVLFFSFIFGVTFNTLCKPHRIFMMQDQFELRARNKDGGQSTYTCRLFRLKPKRV